MFRKNSQDYLKLLLAGLSFSSLAVFSELATNLGIDGLNQLVWRSFFALIGSGIIAFIFLKERFGINKKDWFYLGVNGIFLAGGMCTFTLGIYLGSPIAKAVALNYAYPLVVIIASYFLFHEKISFKGAVATILSIISVLLILEIWQVKNLLSINIGDFLELLNSVFYGLIIVWGKKLGNETKLGNFKSLFYSYIFATLILIFLSFAVTNLFNIKSLGQEIRLLNPTQYLVLAGLATLGMIFPIALMYSAISRVKAYVAGIFLLTEPLWVYIFGIILFHQNLSPWGIIGMFGIILAVLLV